MVEKERAKGRERGKRSTALLLHEGCRGGRACRSTSTVVSVKLEDRQAAREEGEARSYSREKNSSLLPRWLCFPLIDGGPWVASFPSPSTTAEGVGGHGQDLARAFLLLRSSSFDGRTLQADGAELAALFVTPPKTPPTTPGEEEGEAPLARRANERRSSFSETS